MESVMHAASPDRTSPQVTGTPSVPAMWLRAISMTSAAMLLASCNEGVLDPHGPVGKAERVILYDSTAIMLAVIIPVIVLTLVFAWWFRARNKRARYRPDFEYSGRIEMIIWSIPALIILFLGGRAASISPDLDDGHEQLFRASVGQSDLYDAEHGHAAQFGGRPARHFRGSFSAVQW